MPLVSRDEIKEGYVNTFGVKHDELLPDANARATDTFFELVHEHLTRKTTFIILCLVDDEIAARRYLERGLADQDREFYHGDNMVVHYRRTGEILPYASYIPPSFELPTLKVLTDGEYVPSIEGIMERIRSRV